MLILLAGLGCAGRTAKEELPGGVSLTWLPAIRLEVCKGQSFAPAWLAGGHSLALTCLESALGERRMLVEVRREGSRLVTEQRVAQVEDDASALPAKLDAHWKVLATKPPPEWALSPDGERLAYVYPYRGGRNLMLADRKEQHAIHMRPLTRWPFDVFAPTWSPDGRYLAAFTNFDRARRPESHSLILLPTDVSVTFSGMALADFVAGEDVFAKPGTIAWWGPPDDPSARVMFVRKETPPELVLADHKGRVLISQEIDVSEIQQIRLSQEGFLAIETLTRNERTLWLSALAITPQK